jgi:hypothetical protein
MQDMAVDKVDMLTPIWSGAYQEISPEHVEFETIL